MSVLAAGAAAASRLAYLADDTDVGDETHKAGPIAILVIVILCVACFVLFRSMSRHLRKVREGFPDLEAGQEPTDAATPTDALAPEVRPAGSTRPAPKSRTRTPDDSAAR